MLHFISFDLSDNGEKLDIFYGNSTAAPKKHSLRGSRLPSDIISSGNTVFLYYEYISDSSNHFRIQYFETTKGKPALVCSI